MMLHPIAKLPMLKMTSKNDFASCVLLYRPKLTRNQTAQLKSGHAEKFLEGRKYLGQIKNTLF